MLAVLALIVVGKSLIAFAIIMLLRLSAIGTGLMVSASLAQIGEFSFILTALGISSGLVPSEGRDLVVAGALFSIMLNPLVFARWQSCSGVLRLPRRPVPPTSARRLRILAHDLEHVKARAEERTRAQELELQGLLDQFPICRWWSGKTRRPCS